MTDTLCGTECRKKIEMEIGNCMDNDPGLIQRELPVVGVVLGSKNFSVPEHNCNQSWKIIC